jgi:hypothetical protein
MSFNPKSQQMNTLDTGVKIIGYAAMLYIAYKVIVLIFFMILMILLFTLPKNDPVKIELAKKGINGDTYIDG